MDSCWGGWSAEIKWDLILTLIDLAQLRRSQATVVLNNLRIEHKFSLAGKSMVEDLLE